MTEVETNRNFLENGLLRRLRGKKKKKKKERKTEKEEYEDNVLEVIDEYGG